MNLGDALGDWPAGGGNNPPTNPSWPAAGGGGAGGAWPGGPAPAAGGGAWPAGPAAGGGAWPAGPAAGGGAWPAGPAAGGGAWPAGPAPAAGGWPAGPAPAAGGGAWPGPQPGGQPGGGGAWPGPQPGGQMPSQPSQPGWPSPSPGPGPGPGPGYAPQQSLKVPYSMTLPGGVHDKMLITIAGTIKSNADKFAVDLKTPTDLAFHFNPRFNEDGKKVIVRNSCISKNWGKEERDLQNFPFQQGKPFEMKILCTNKEFKVAVNNSHVLAFHHRVSNLRSINTLNIHRDVTLSKVNVENMP